MKSILILLTCENINARRMEILKNYNNPFDSAGQSFTGWCSHFIIQHIKKYKWVIQYRFLLSHSFWCQGTLMGKTEGNLYYQMRMYIYGDNQILFIFKKKKYYINFLCIWRKIIFTCQYNNVIQDSSTVVRQCEGVHGVWRCCRLISATLTFARTRLVGQLLMIPEDKREAKSCYHK